MVRSNRSSSSSCCNDIELGALPPGSRDVIDLMDYLQPTRKHVRTSPQLAPSPERSIDASNIREDGTSLGLFIGTRICVSV